MTNKYFVIPDIHGEVDKLSQYLKDIDGEFKVGDTMVFLGDYVDRGEHSKDVLSLLSFLKFAQEDVKILLGNHDYYFIKFIDSRGLNFDDVEWAQRYMIETLQSFCADAHESYGEFLEHLRTINLYAVKHDMDIQYKAWLYQRLNEVRWFIKNNFQLELDVLREAYAYYEDDFYVFSHSGGKAGDVPIGKQHIMDILESRDFSPREKLHIIGHTPQGSGVTFHEASNILACDVGAVFFKERKLPIITLSKEEVDIKGIEHTIK